MSPLVAFVVTRLMVLLWILGPVIVIALIRASILIARRGNLTAGPVRNTLVFRYPPSVRRVSVIFALGLVGTVGGIVVAHPPQDWADTVYILLAFTMFGGLGSVLLWDVFRFRLEVGPDGLDCRSPWRPQQFICWEDVKYVSFNNPLGWFEVRAMDGRYVRLPALVGGLEAFLEACERRLTPSQLKPAIPAYIFLGRPFQDE